MMRFQRQMKLREIGSSGQMALSQSRVLVIGAGGLGHPVMFYLAAAGVGTVAVVDGDKVSESNLHRQILFDRHDLGANKAEVIVQKFAKREEPIRTRAYPNYLTTDLALELFPEYDVIVDGTDNFASKFLINDVCGLLNKPMIFGSISGFEGQVSVFWRGEGPCYRCLVREIPRADIQNCAEGGVVGALPGVVGSWQAIETLKVLLRLKNLPGRLKPLVGRLQVLDLAESEARQLRIPIRRDCRCQKSDFSRNDIERFDLWPAVSIDDSVVVDVREADELENFRLEKVFHWPLSRLQAGEFPTELINRDVTTICLSGVRARRAAELMKAKGFNSVQFTQTSVYGCQTR